MRKKCDSENIQELFARSIDTRMVYMYVMEEINKDRAVSPLDTMY